MGEPNSQGGSHLSKRKKKDVVGNVVDRISALLDEILVSIMSLLPLKEAQATSVLARRWQYVWAYRTSLNFDDEKNFLSLGKVRSDSGFLLKRFRHISWVDGVLRQHRASKIDRFRVSFELKPRSCFNEWIQLAMTKGVQMLELDFTGYQVKLCFDRYPYQSEEKYIFSNKTFALNSSCVEYIGFKCLKDLDLKSVNVDQETLEYFMLNCPFLERLAVYNSKTLLNLRVVGLSIALKNLMIRRCYNAIIGTIEIRDANLVSFSYDGRVKNLVISNVPHLIEVSIWGGERLTNDLIGRTFCHLSDCFSHLEVLMLDYMNVSCKRDPVIPSLPNLKRLELAIDHINETYALLHLASFIKKSPSMHTLVLQLSHPFNTKPPFAKKRAAKFSHDCLKVIQIVDYMGCSRQNELVKYLTKNASSLEMVILDPRPVDPFCWWNSLRNYCNVQSNRAQPGKVDGWRAQAQQLKEKLPTTLEVVCM